MLCIQARLFPLVFLLSAIALHAPQLQALEARDSYSVKSAVFLSPPFFQQPGSVSNKYYFDVPFPRGHIALKSFNAEVVDEMGVPVPLHKTYLHHWAVGRYYGRKGVEVPSESNLKVFQNPNFILVLNSGICGSLWQYFGIGSETRRTSTWVPDPYGIEVGNPTEIPDGYEEKWMINIHAIDTRGVEDRMGCTECRCDLYNVTKDENGQPLKKDYIGGLFCCYDQTHCRLRKGFEGVRRKLYLRYTVKWVDWDTSVVPVKIYIFDVTDTVKYHNASTKIDFSSSCKIEYDIKSCSMEGKHNGECAGAKKKEVDIPQGGDIVYGVAHQHAGGTGSTLFGQDGRVLCTSIPTYGEGKEPGNESGYIVGMSTCYPSPGSIRVADGEVLTLESNYSSTEMHTGVMGIFYILVAEPQPQANTTVFQSLANSVRDEAA